MQIHVTGIVQEGAGRGRELGYPTANFPLTTIVSDGVYITETQIDAFWYPSLTFVGPASTFGQQERKVETMLFDMDVDLYGAEITVSLIRKLRGNKQFRSIQCLVTQMQHDERQARLFFSALEA